MKTITGDCNTFNLSSIIVFTDYHDDFVWHFSSVFYKEIVFFFFTRLDRKNLRIIFGAHTIIEEIWSIFLAALTQGFVMQGDFLLTPLNLVSGQHFTGMAIMEFFFFTGIDNLWYMFLPV